MTKKILFVVNELPYPPRNGVTIPSYYYLEDLQDNDVDLLFLPRNKSEYTKEQIDLNSRFFKKIFVLPLYRMNTLKIILSHFLFFRPSFFSYDYDSADLQQMMLNSEYDIIIYTPISSTVVHRELKELTLQAAPKTIGIFNDCFSYAVKTLGSLNTKKFNLGALERIKLAGRLINSFWLKYFERNIVNEMDLVVCQTDVDANAFREIGCKRELLILPNGVSPELYNLKLKSSDIKRVLFLGSLGGKYSFIVEWLIKTAWPQIVSEFPSLKLKLVGKGLSPELRQYVSNDSTIEYFPFIDKITDAYSDSQVFIAPIFMKCGLINKVIEAMAAGLVVLGDTTAFNGISNFRRDVHGLVIENHEEIVDQLRSLLSDDIKFVNIQSNAKKLILADFNWKTRTKIFKKYLQANEQI